MLGIKKNGYFLDLYPNIVISIEINNSVMDDDVVKGNYSFPFKIPLTARNKVLFGFPEIVANSTSIQISEQVELWVDGLLLFPGATLQIKDVNATFINVYVLVGISTLADYAGKTKIVDKVDYPVRNFDPESANANDVKDFAKSTITATVDEFPIVYPTLVNNSHYQNQIQEITGGMSKDVVYNLYMEYGPAEFRIVDRVIVTDQETEAGQKHARLMVVPFIYVTYLVRKIFQGIPLEENIFESDPDLKKLILYNNFSLEKWYPIYEQYFLNRNNRSLDLKNHVPDMTVADFIVALKKVFCLFFYKDPFTDKVYFNAFKNVVNDQDYIDWTDIALKEYSIEETLSKGMKYLPDTSDSIMAAVGTMLNVVRKPSVVREVDLPVTGNTIGDVRMVEETGQLYTYQNLILFSTWLPYTSALGDYYMPPAQYEFKNALPGIVPTKVKFYPANRFDFSDEYLVPTVGIPGSYLGNDNKQIASPMVSKLLFYHGMRTSQGGRHYPFASSHNYDYGKHRVGNYSLSWDGTDGLYNVWWKDFIKMKDNTKQVFMDVNLTMPILLKLDLRKKVRIGSDNFLIKKISLQLPLIKPARVELWKVD